MNSRMELCFGCLLPRCTTDADVGQCFDCAKPSVVDDNDGGLILNRLFPGEYGGNLGTMWYDMINVDDRDDSWAGADIDGQVAL